MFYLRQNNHRQLSTTISQSPTLPPLPVIHPLPPPHFNSPPPLPRSPPPPLPPQETTIIHSYHHTHCLHPPACYHFTVITLPYILANTPQFSVTHYFSFTNLAPLSILSATHLHPGTTSRLPGLDRPRQASK